MCVAGRLIKIAFDYRSGKFVCEFQDDPAVTAPGEFFVPELQYPNGFKVKADGDLVPAGRDQVWQYLPAQKGGLHRIEISRCLAGQ
jgi:hypothetical protein